jgi:hypothetical protein
MQLPKCFFEVAELGMGTIKKNMSVPISACIIQLTDTVKLQQE